MGKRYSIGKFQGKDDFESKTIQGVCNNTKNDGKNLSENWL